MSSVRVAVRCRPFNSREKRLATSCVISMEGQTTTIEHPEIASKSHTFSFDHSYWSHDEADDHFASQTKVFEEIGLDSLEHAFAGYNICLFAYGQTGSGKSYTMMGLQEDEGIIPRMCERMFATIADLKDSTVSVEVSYMEIYCERVRDLLNPQKKTNLRVREHPLFGPYVENLARLAVTSFADISILIDEGNKARTVAATNMNETSSRSHAVFTILLTQRPRTGKLVGEKVSKLSLVDLAGSERADSTGAKGDRLKEGAMINKSLTTLGKVISALADLARGGTTKKKKAGEFIPYRDSVLTWLLKENLGGNSKTAMIAAISPAAVNFDETLSTLRYADRAKAIVCAAVVNEDANAKMIRELREEVERLRSELVAACGTKKRDTVAEEQLEQSEALMHELSETWEAKLERTNEIGRERELALKQAGVFLQADGGTLGIAPRRDTPHLLNLNEDAQMNECLVYYMKEGETTVGTEGEIALHADGILPLHCSLIREGTAVILRPRPDAACYLNGSRVECDVTLTPGNRLIFGTSAFRYQGPGGDDVTRSGTAADWGFAYQELLEQQGIDLRGEMEQALEKLQDAREAERVAAAAAMEEQREHFEEQIRSLQLEVDVSRRAISSMTASEFHLGSSTLSDLPIWPDLSERELQLAMWTFRKWRYHQHTSLQDVESCIQSPSKLKDQLYDCATILTEANAISAELSKMVKFQFVLLTPTRYCVLADDLAQEGRDTVVACEVRDSRNGATHYWSLEKLSHRLNLMRQLYSLESETAGVCADDFPFADPFYDRFPWFRSVGRGLVYASHLLLGVGLIQRVAVSDTRGRVRAHLRVALQPMNDIEDTTAEFTPLTFNSTETNDDSGLDESCGDSGTETQLELLRRGDDFRFRVNLLQLQGLGSAFSDVYIQFSFPEVCSSTFSTEPLKNSPDTPLGFYKSYDLETVVTSSFLNFCRREAVLVEVFAHEVVSPPPPPQPSPNSLGNQLIPPDQAQQRRDQSERELDALAWLQMRELGADGSWTPAPLDGDLFLLRHGLQRRLCLLLRQEQGAPRLWRGVTRLAVGDVRATPGPTSSHAAPLDLPLLSAAYADDAESSALCYRIEAVWDSSLHNSHLLNRLTPNGERVFITLHLGIEIEDATGPAETRKTIAVRVGQRDAALRGLKSWLLSRVDVDTMCCLVSVRMSRAGGRRRRRLQQPTREYVRGEENLEANWRPRRDSLIAEHQRDLDRVRRLQRVERVRHALLVREQLGALGREEELRSMDDAVSPRPEPLRTDNLAATCLQLLQSGRCCAPDESTVSLTPPDSLIVPAGLPKSRSCCELSAAHTDIQWQARLDFVSMPAAVAREGVLSLLEDAKHGWHDVYVTVRRPYVLLSRSQTDTLVRGAINLKNATVEVSEDITRPLFTVLTAHRGLVVRCPPEQFDSWLYAFSPLLAGQIRSRRSRTSAAVTFDS